MGGLCGFLRFAVVAGLLFGGAQIFSAISERAGAVVGSFITGSSPAQTADPHAASPGPTTAANDGGTGPDGLRCDALSAERLSTYVNVPVTAWHQMDGGCMWVTDPSDRWSVVVTAEQLSAASVAHLPGDTVSLSPSVSLDPPGPTSVLMAREGQYIPVADRRTATLWPIKVEIMRGPLGIDDARGQQIIRAVAADLNAASE